MGKQLYALFDKPNLSENNPHNEEATHQHLIDHHNMDRITPVTGKQHNDFSADKNYYKE